MDILKVTPDSGFAAPMRCLVHPQLGLCLCTSDVVRSIGFRAPMTIQLERYSPAHTFAVPHNERRATMLKFTAFDICYRWGLSNVTHSAQDGDTAWDKLAEWAREIRKFPIVEVPETFGQYRHVFREGLFRRQMASLPDEDRATPEQSRKQRFHLVDWIDALPVEILFRDGKAYISWASAAGFLGKNHQLNPQSTYPTVMRYWTELHGDDRRYASEISQQTLKNGGRACVIRPELFMDILFLYARKVYEELTTLVVIDEQYKDEVVNGERVSVPYQRKAQHWATWDFYAAAHAIDPMGKRYLPQPNVTVNARGEIQHEPYRPVLKPR